MTGLNLDDFAYSSLPGQAYDVADQALTFEVLQFNPSLVATTCRVVSVSSALHPSLEGLDNDLEADLRRLNPEKFPDVRNWARARRSTRKLTGFVSNSVRTDRLPVIAGGGVGQSLNATESFGSRGSPYATFRDGMGRST
ncbi:hypothetical protein LTR15_001038 [Elasticomyces elasticus]|nr:hypothetical protein LTR15_001038 [Elasticomyces elasticus]